jgi:lipopolysaccharide export system protein LptA
MRGIAAMAISLTLAGHALTVESASPRPARVAAVEESAPGPAPAAKKPSVDKAGDDKQPVTVDADRMERFGKESLIIFTGNVVARQNNSVQYADRTEVYLDEKGDKILRTVSTGSVRIITRDCRTGTAKRAEYYDLEQRVVLLGNARVWQEDNVVSGETITIFLSQDRSIVQGGKSERVKAIFYSKDSQSQSVETRPSSKGGPAPCAN